jgi:hypothetical protein
MAEPDGSKDANANADKAKAAPHEVVLKVKSPLGPFARLFPKRGLSLEPVVVLLPEAAAGVEADHDVAASLCMADSGIAVSGRLEAHPVGDGATGKLDRLALRGEVPVLPGRYAATVRLPSDAADRPMLVPITVEVAASPA